MSNQAILILDSCGLVRCCSDLALFGIAAKTLQGRPLASLIPTLGLHENAPVANVALARSWWADGPWKSHKLHRLDGHQLPLEICLHAIVLDDTPYLLAMLRGQRAPARAPVNASRGFPSVGSWPLLQFGI
jgi:hypothetical protein